MLFIVERVLSTIGYEVLFYSRITKEMIFILIGIILVPIAQSQGKCNFVFLHNYTF